jgi:serine protease Do
MAIIPYAQGIGFAIPINFAKSCADDILTEGAAKKPWLGIIGLSITQQIARYYNLPVDHGVLVTKVADGSPAEKAGMADGDIILQIDNVELRRIEDLVVQLRKMKVGEKVKIFALRDGREYFFEFKLRETP